jgi:hypothetical protein
MFLVMDDGFHPDFLLCPQSYLFLHRMYTAAPGFLLAQTPPPGAESNKGEGWLIP